MEKPCFVFRLNDHGQGPDLVRQMFLERGWVEYDEELQTEWDWNVWWKTSRFRTCEYEQVLPCQQLNHFQKATAITKKDSLARNLKRMKGIYGPNVYNFSPIAFNLPNDYTKFVAEYTKLKDRENSGIYWICKPADMSRGRGIFLFKDLSDLQYDCNAVVQQYISNPLLVSGYKFDLRIYVAVPSFHPLRIYVYEEGLSRFSTEKFDLNNLGNSYSHLTNTSINKYSPMYGADKERVGPGCKWTLTQLRHYLHQSNIDDQMIWTRIIHIITLTLLIQAQQVPKSVNTFELFGFDVMIDDNLKPWLLEVNFSPALAADTQLDLLVKKPMLHDLIDILHFQERDRYRTNDKAPKRDDFQTRSMEINQRPTPRSHSSIDRLPHIQHSNSSTMLPQNQNTIPEDTDGPDEIVQIVPGCGLPSVQQANTWAHLRAGSRSSSACSSNNSGPFGDSQKTIGSARMLNRKTHSQTSIKSIDVDSNNKQRAFHLPRDRNDNHSAVPRMWETKKKDYINSTGTGASEHAELACKPDGDASVKPVKYAHNKWRVYGDSVMDDPSAEDESQPKSQRSSQARGKLSSAYSVTSHYSQQSIASSRRHSMSRFGNSSVTSASARRRPLHPVKKHANRSTGSPRLGMRRSWQDASPTRTCDIMKNTPDRVGDFLLIFPFNDVTRKSAINNLDTRLVIRECHKQLKQRPQIIQKVYEEALMTNQPHLLNKYLWAPLRLTDPIDR